MSASVQVGLLLWAAHINAQRTEKAAATQRAKAQRLAQLRLQSTGIWGARPAEEPSVHIRMPMVMPGPHLVEEMKEDSSWRMQNESRPTETTPLCNEPPPGLVYIT